MPSTDPAAALSLTNATRTLFSVAAGVAYAVERAVVGEARVRTARRNAWEAVCADRDRARHRAEMGELVAGLAQVTVGSSPRSKASHASLTGSVRA
jgi:hypothetical protein